MHTPYIKRTINKQARNQRFEHASKTKTHKSKTNRKTNKQETHGILYRNLFRFFVRKAMFQKMTKWHVCYAHMIHQTNVKQTNKKQTIYTQASLFWVSMFDTPHSILLCTTQTKTSEAN